MTILGSKLTQGSHRFFKVEKVFYFEITAYKD